MVKTLNGILYPEVYTQSQGLLAVLSIKLGLRSSVRSGTLVRADRHPRSRENRHDRHPRHHAKL